MQTDFTVYRPGQPAEPHSADLPEEPGYDRLKTLVTPFLDGACLEHVTVLRPGSETKAKVTRDDDYLDMFVDEEGTLKRLPVNDDATRIYRANWLRAYPGTPPDTLAEIYGPAVLFHRRVWF
jgi:hypothetical protein